jgi:hypothetical protein
MLVNFVCTMMFISLSAGVLPVSTYQEWQVTEMTIAVTGLLGTSVATSSALGSWNGRRSAELAPLNEALGVGDALRDEIVNLVFDHASDPAAGASQAAKAADRVVAREANVARRHALRQAVTEGNSQKVAQGVRAVLGLPDSLLPRDAKVMWLLARGHPQLEVSTLLADLITEENEPVVLAAVSALVAEVARSPVLSAGEKRRICLQEDLAGYTSRFPANFPLLAAIVFGLYDANSDDATNILRHIGAAGLRVIESIVDGPVHDRMSDIIAELDES